ncbi:penicillin-binding transpeptidase domain-containing protein [Lachnoclostridium sp. MSJ-17]|uniref:penicillin-binding transpeptidase domain-containing protein n=1 Tax=Lachnoclostridium sp. MSJ-17 TaxID=2841516 RepID=UPI001C11962E|nr:penicillin-binding transpeptidase domain-containing protein [Lachnoclostridium sp. MSJ-17]MBU5461136.1 penicillin-binding protein [Lachnoclostridium sp. MSJ-17]
MKRILKRSTLILAFTILFIGGASFFCVELVLNADDWANQPYNAHISGNGGLEQAGAVYDRNGAALAKTQGTDRVYNENYSVRVGLLHTVGDNSLNISTAVQSKYRSQLTGYSLIWGLNMPQSLRTSHDITLTVDANASAATYDALSAYGKQGACVVYNYKTGEVISSVSTYSYDPEAPPEINESNEHEYEGVYLDHVLSSTYTPGSIFKLVTAAAAIENIPDLFERTWYCEGHEDIGGAEVRCVDGEAHGTLDFYGALEHSCNIVFAELAVELGPEKMTAAAEKMGINLSYEIDDVSTAKGHYDVSKASTNELAWSGVGQYNDEVNPMQMAILCGAIANGGNSVNPTYIKSGTGDLLKMIGLNDTKSRELLKSSTASTLSQSMPSYSFGSLSVRAKTGTAEVGEEKNPNAWMVGFSTDEDCPLAFACVVEDAGFGSQYARPVAETAMQSAAQALRGY